MRKNQKLIRNLIVVGVILSLNSLCYGLQLKQIGDVFTKDKLPKVTEAIDKVLGQPDINSAQKATLDTLKKQVADVQAAWKKHDAAAAEKERVNVEVGSIRHSGVDKQGHPYEWSGHTTAEGKPEPKWVKAQADEQAAVIDALGKKDTVQQTIQSLDPALQGKLESLLANQ